MTAPARPAAAAARGPVSILPVTPEQVPRLHTALLRLSQDLGDTHRAGPEALLAAGFGPHPAFAALLAEGTPQGAEPLGAVMYSPLFSTVRGEAGLFVSDLWVGPGNRGLGLGPRLLGAARDRAAADFGARFLRLTVYASNPRARSFYLRLGFSGESGTEAMTAEGAALDALGGSG